MNSQADST